MIQKLACKEKEYSTKKFMKVCERTKHVTTRNYSLGLVLLGFFFKAKQMDQQRKTFQACAYTGTVFL